MWDVKPPCLIGVALFHYTRVLLYYWHCFTTFAWPTDARPALLYRNGQWFRGGLVFKTHRHFYHSALASRVMQKKKKKKKKKPALRYPRRNQRKFEPVERRGTFHPRLFGPLERLRENLADFNEKRFKNLYQDRLDGPITGHVLVQISRFLKSFSAKLAKFSRNRAI